MSRGFVRSWIGDLTRDDHVIATDLFLRSLGLIYCIAFVSLWTQIDGLIGSEGILPAAEYFDFLARRLDESRYYRLPTLCWLSASDVFLHALCGAGVAASLLGVVLPYSKLLWLVPWALYLSLIAAGQTFLSFQWDILLVETGFLALFLAPLTVRPRSRHAGRPPVAGVWLVRWLLFRLMFASGVVKLAVVNAEGTSAWRDLTALLYHYETQCLPPWTAWFVHQLPAWFHQISEIGMFTIELVLPFFIFFPRPLRLLAFAGLVFLQVLILLTGNYCFFNLLSVCLCLPLLDDAAWPHRIRALFLGPADADETAPRRRPGRWAAWVAVPLAATIFLVSWVPLARAFRFAEPVPWPGWLRTAHDYQAPFHIVNGYGLFANMTTTRPEIIVEGSSDGRTWQPYEFRYKPGELSRRPSFVAPHQPRLDWQMWFAALGTAQRNPWFVRFCSALVEGRAPVVGLLESNPFPDAPPRYVRANLYRYHFTTFAERGESGDWWTREHIGLYMRPIAKR